MALQADIGWNQHGTRDVFDEENEGFTERAAGLVGLAEIIAYEMTGNTTSTRPSQRAYCQHKRYAASR